MPGGNNMRIVATLMGRVTSDPICIASDVGQP